MLDIKDFIPWSYVLKRVVIYDFIFFNNPLQYEQ